MAKRISKRRLQILEAQGQDLTQSVGPSMSASVGYMQRTSDNALWTTEMTFDLANGTTPAYSWTTAGYGTGVGNMIGATASVAMASMPNAQIALNTISQMGVCVETELVCVEQPTGGAVIVGLAYGEQLSGSGMDTRDATISCALTSMDVGVFTTSGGAIDADLDGMYWYLISSGSTSAAYTAGKFIVRWYGYQVFDDIA